MSSPNTVKFPGEDFFHPGFTPAGLMPIAVSDDEVLPSRPDSKPKKSLITRKPVPNSSQQNSIMSPKPNPLAMNPVSISSPQTESGTSTTAESEQKVGICLDLAHESNAKAQLAVPIQNMLSNRRVEDEVTAPNSAYGDSNEVSTNPSQPSPPAPWPARPHIQKDYASSQLHGGDAPVQGSSQPVSPISDSDYFYSTQASRVNSLAYGGSQQTIPPISATSDTPMPPLPIEYQKLPEQQHEKVIGEQKHEQETATRSVLFKKRHSTNNWPLGLDFNRSSDDMNPTVTFGKVPEIKIPGSQTSPDIMMSPTVIAAPPPSQLRASNTQQQMFGPHRASQQYQPRLSHCRFSQNFIPYRASHPQYTAPMSCDPRSSLPPLFPPAQRSPINSQQSRYSSATMGGTTPFLHHDDEEGFFDSHKKEFDRNGTAKFSAAESTYSIFSSFHASWLPEILWILLSITCLGIIAVILSRFDQESLLELPLPITLNTLVAFLVTICHAALIFPVIQGVSQLRWNWFAREDRSLTDFQAFEDARTGPIGAMRLLIASKGQILHFVLAITMFLGLVTSAMTQMIIAYPTRVPAGSGAPQVFKAEAYPNINNPTTSSLELDRSQKQSIQYGIYYPSGVPVKPLPPTCTSNECQTQKFSSLAVCSRIDDISSRLEVSSDSLTDDLIASLGMDSSREVRNASLSNGAYLIGSSDTYNLNMTSSALVSSGSNSANISLAFSDQPDLMAAAISNVFIIYTTQASFGALGSSTPASDTKFGAIEILFHFCVAQYTVEGGTKVYQQTPLFETRIEESSTVLFEAGKGYKADRNSAAALARYMALTFDGTFSAAMGSGAMGYTGTSDAFGSAMFGSPSRTLPEKDQLTAMRNMTQNVANSLTNTIRFQGSQPTAVAVKHETYVSIRWGWFAFLVSQVVLAAGFLVGVIIETILLDVCVLKSSALAGMFAVSAEDRKLLEAEEIGRVDEGHVMASTIKAVGIRGRFVGSGDRDGWVLDLGVR